MKEQSLNYFQTNCAKYFKSFGFNADNANTIFSIIIEMRNICIAAEKADTVLLHKHMGMAIEAVTNYASTNSIKLNDAVGLLMYSQMERAVEFLDLEFYLELVRDDLSLQKDMPEEEKIEFIQKCWTAVFPMEYHNDFIKIDKILRQTILDNQIKYPQINK